MAEEPLKIEDANRDVLDRIRAATPFLVDLRPAGEVMPGLEPREFLHAGPPLEGWREACGALRGAIVGTIVRSGLARGIEEAEQLAARDGIRLTPAHDRNALGTFAAPICATTPVFVIENRAAGVRAFAAINEGRGKALRYGSTDAETMARLEWLEGGFAEIVRKAIASTGGIDLFEIVSQALHMGDDGHSRQKASSALFLATIGPAIADSGFPAAETARALRFLSQNDFFFLPLAMAAAKSAMAAAEGIPGSTIVTAMAFNGVRCGIRVGGTGSHWWTAPVPAIHGQYFQGYSAADAGPVIGDSEITETIGLGAFAMAGAPALARYVGGTLEDAMRFSTEMYKVTAAEHPRFTIPALGFRGTALGIDARRVAESGIEPVFNTGIAHRTAGVGQIGAGYGRAPIAAFRSALEAIEGGAGQPPPPRPAAAAKSRAARSETACPDSCAG